MIDHGDHRPDPDHTMAHQPSTEATDMNELSDATDVPGPDDGSGPHDVPDRAESAPEAGGSANDSEAANDGEAGDAGMGEDDGVAIRTLVVGGLPLLVAGVGDAGRGPQLRTALEERGVAALSSFIGAELPRGAKVGFMLGTTELRLVDDRDDTMLRAARDGLDEGWLAAARRLKGTMTVVVRGASPAPELAASELAAVVDERARDGDAWGAIIGFAEDRLNLPLLF